MNIKTYIFVVKRKKKRINGKNELFAFWKSSVNATEEEAFLSRPTNWLTKKN